MTAGLDAADTASPPAETPQELEDDAEMAAYNEYLAELAEQDKAAGLDWRRPRRPRGVEPGSGGRARTSNIRLQRPTFCRLNYPGPWSAASRRG